MNPAKEHETERKECMVKKCRRNGVVIQTNGAYCTQCGSKLKAVYDSRPATITEPGIGSPEQSNLTVIGEPPAKPAEQMVQRKHLTVQQGQEWVCWCGFKCPAADGRMAGGHDGLGVETVPISSVEAGGLYYPIKEPSAAFSTTQSAKPTQSDNWGCNPDVKGCPMFTPESAGSKLNMLGETLVRPRIEIPHEMWKKWVHLAGAVNTEWLAYLIGERLPVAENAPIGGWKITDMWFPRQRVTPAHVTVSEEDLRNLKEGTIGDVHSHVKMSSYFSTEDERHFNHEVHIVVNARAEVASSIRVQLECRRTSRSTGHLVLTNLEDSPEIAWEDELKATFQPDPPSASPAVSSAASASGVQLTTSTDPIPGHTGQSAYTGGVHGPSRGQNTTYSGNPHDTWKAN